MMIVSGYLFAFLYAIVVLLIGAFAHKLGLDRKYSRKIIHILIGFEWFILSSTHGTSFHFVIVCLLFLAFLSVVYYKNWLPMMSSGQDNAKGTIYYAFSMTVLAIVTFFYRDFSLFFGMGVLATSIGDGLGGIVGQAIKQRTNLYKNKTLLGTLTVFVSTFLSLFLFIKAYALSLSVFELLAICVFCAGVELICIKGLDNILVPFSVSAFSYLLYINKMDGMMFTIALVPLFVAITIGKKKLTVGGAICAMILALLVGFAFGDFGFCLLVVFFLLAIVTDQAKHIVKDKKTHGECRGTKQVLATSVFALLSALSYLVYSHPAFLCTFVLSLAEALGDTAASGLGVLAKGAYDPFRRRHVEKGESGGISVIGTIGGLFFCLAFLFFSGILFSLRFPLVILLFACSIVGISVDSALGSLVQLRFLCKKCGKIVEDAKHCGENTEYYSGVRPFDNAFVNLMGVSASVALFILVYFVFNI